MRELEALDQLVQTRQESVEKVWEKLEKVLVSAIEANRGLELPNLTTCS